MPFPDRTRL